MKYIQPQPDWPDSWQLSYRYDQLEIYGDRTLPGYTYAYQNRRQHTLRFVQQYVPKGGLILDLAAAQGNFSLALAELGYDVTWNDLRAELIEYVQLKWQHGTIHYQPGNIFELQPKLQTDLQPELPLELQPNLPLDTQFDAVLITEVIEHVAHPDDFLKQVANLVKPNGFIIMSTPNGEYIQNRLPKFSDCPNPEQFDDIQFQANSDGHIFLLHWDEVEHLAAQANLAIAAGHFCTNPLTNGYLKLGHLLKVLPSRWVSQLEQWTTALPSPLRRKFHTCMVVAFTKLH